MISVIIPLYNKQDYIKHTIESVLNQTFEDFELIVINDGSQDQGVEIVKSFSDRRIRLIEQSNRGVSSARNRGILEARFEYIAFLDADDEWLPNHLENIYLLIKEYSYANVFVTNFAYKYQTGKIVKNRNDLKKGIIKDYFNIILRKALINSSAVCITRNALIKTGMFNQNLIRGEDLDLWIRLAKSYEIVYSPVLSSYYYLGTKNNSKSYGNYIDKSFISYIDFSNVSSLDEKKYLKRLIKRKILSLLIYERDFYNAFKLLKKYKKNMLK